MLAVKKIIFLFNAVCLVFFCTKSIANSSNPRIQQSYLLQKIAQAPTISTAKRQWLTLFEQPGNSQFYYLANKSGQIYQLEQDNAKNTALLLDIGQALPSQAIINLSAFTLHPHFSERDQAGFGTFYTAHIEKANNSTASRLHEVNLSESLKFDAVVTEWKLAVSNQLDPANSREVIRIAVPTAEDSIRQLSFNPYSKAWHDDFSQLFISLSQSAALKKYPLYSGVILRINPIGTASNSYSVPLSNPYYANEKFDKALYLLGAGQIQQFIWPEKHASQLLVSHQYGMNNTPKQWLSYSNGGEDWRKHAPTAFIYQDTMPLSANNLLVYRGQNAPSLRNKLLLITQDELHWQLSSLANEAPLQTNAEQSNNYQSQARLPSSDVARLPSPKIEWQLSQQALLTSQLSLHRDNRGELLFFNEDSGAIYQLFQQDDMADFQETKSDTLSGLTLFLITLFGLLFSYIFYQVKVQNKSAKSLVRKRFSSLVLTQDKLALNLFRRHNPEPEKTITLASIKQCQVLLGDMTVITIDTTADHGFTEQQELEIRKLFHTEQIDKMVDGKVRRISLALNTRAKDSHIICLYLRKGSDRITKRSYFEVVDDVIDWCWLIAKYINSENTEKRIIKPKKTAEEIARAEHKSHDDTPLHKQAAIIRPATHLPEQVMSATDESGDDHDTGIESLTMETDLVNAIEKLGKLHQQGLLSVEEFAQAKAKLLENSNQTE